jgi:hypothetical protein
MCFSATANFAGSGVLGAVGVVTLTRVKHRRELLFAALPTLFAIHQFIEGFVWLGLDGVLSPAVAHDMGAAFMLYAQGLLPFLLPLSVFLFEPNEEPQQDVAVRRTWRSDYALYFVGADGIPIAAVCQRKQYRVHKSGDQQYGSCVALCNCNLWFAILFEDQNDGNLRRGKPGDTAGCNGGQAIRVHVVMVCVRGGGKCDHSRLLLEKPQRAAVPVWLGRLSRSRMSDLSSAVQPRI